jgi:hypothetical protein
MSLEASLAENVARLPMDEIDQYEAFALKRRVAIAELIPSILDAYRRGEIAPRGRSATGHGICRHCRRKAGRPNRSLRRARER